MREPLGRSRNQTQATSAPHSGTVALRMALKPVLMCSTAKQYSAKGRPLLSTPTIRMGPSLARRAGICCCHSSKGSKKSEAKNTRKKAVTNGPNSAAPIFISRKDAPHRAASKTKSIAALAFMCARSQQTALKLQ